MISHRKWLEKNFQKTGFSNNLDGSKEDYLWNECEGEGEEVEVDEYIPPS